SELLDVTPQPRRDLPKDAFDLTPFLGVELAYLVVQIEACSRLHVDGLACRRHVLYESLHLPPGFCTNGDHHPPVTHGGLVLGGVPLPDGTAKLLLKHLPKPGLLLDDRPPDSTKLRRGVVPEVSFVVHAPFDLSLQIG